MRCFNPNNKNRAIVKEFFWTSQFNWQGNRYVSAGSHTFTVKYLCPRCRYRSVQITEYDDDGPWEIECPHCGLDVFIPASAELTNRKR